MGEFHSKGAAHFDFVLFLVPILFCGLIVASNLACAEKADNETIAIGPARYQKTSLIKDFLNIAYSETRLAEALSTYPIPENIQQEIDAKLQPEWFAQLVHPDTSDLRLNTLHKWTQRIRISVQWPYGLNVWPPFDNPLPADHFLDALIADHVNMLLPELAKTTGLNISFMSRDAESEGNFANIRIVYKSQFCSFVNSFKETNCEPWSALAGYGYHPPAHRTFHHWLTMKGHELDLWRTIIPFTPDRRAQVDGMFFLDGNNNIDFAVCTILTIQPETMIRALITECLLRALGLPGIASIEDEQVLRSALGPWNTRHEPYALLDYLDGARANERGMSLDDFFSEEILKKEIWKDVNRPSWWTNSGKSLARFRDEITKSENLPAEPTAYDLFMLRLLYQPSMQSGMDKETAYDVLLHYVNNQQK